MSDRNPVGSTRRPSTIWHFSPEIPLLPSPYFDWPWKPLGVLVHLLNSWNPAGWRFLMLAFAWAIWTWATPDLGAIAAGGVGWAVAVAVRNLAILMVVAGGLHLWLLAFGKQGSDGKYDKRPMAKGPRIFFFRSQVWDNILWSCVAWVFWSLWECSILWAYATGVAPMVSWENDPAWIVAVAVLVPIWAGVHFYWLHRLLHVGKLYTWVHSWHHKNINTGPWSGLAMHPVESFFLFFDTLIFLLLPAHPVLAIFLLLHHGIGAPVSHAGFEYLKLCNEKLPLGDFFHQLHHRFFDCNYGTLDTPWDKWFGTFHDGTPEADQLITSRRRASTVAAKR